MPVAAAIDPLIEAGADLVHSLMGRATSVLRPHTVQRSDRGTVADKFLVKTTTAAGQSSVPCHVFDGSEQTARGTIFQGHVVTINGTDYTLTADASAVSNVWTLAITPVLDAEATAADAVTLPDVVTFTGFTRLDRTIGAQSYNPSGFAAGTKVMEVRPPETLPSGFTSFRSGNEGDLLSDATDGTLGRITQIIDEAPEAVEVVVG